jgi:hypothetical protein
MDSIRPDHLTPAARRHGRHPLAWVPTLYLAQGLPFYSVALVAGLMFKSMGVPNEQIARWTGMLGLAWVFKALWSPFLELAASKKRVVVVLQVTGGIALAALALALQLPAWFGLAIALLGLVSLASSTHDIAADGLYIASLSARQQAAYAGWQGAFFNGAKFLSLGGLVILAGFLEQRIGPPAAWATVFGLLGALLAGLGLYHVWALPETAKTAAGASVSGSRSSSPRIPCALRSRPTSMSSGGVILPLGARRLGRTFGGRCFGIRPLAPRNGAPDPARAGAPLVPHLQHSGLTQERSHRVRRLRANAEPVIRALGIHVQTTLCLPRVVVPDRLDEAPIARAPYVSHHDAIHRSLFPPHTAKSNPYHFLRSPSRGCSVKPPGSSRHPAHPERTRELRGFRRQGSAFRNCRPP